jgi:hypothetical protein
MMHKKTIASSTVALFAAGLVIVACSDSEDPPPPPAATGGSSGSATGGTATGGTATGGTATGGTATGGTATGGTATGGSATGGSAGSGAGSGGAAMGFACDMPKTPNCGAIADFPNSTSQTFGNADFSGGASVFGAGISRDMTTGGLHVTGMVTGYGHGFNIWFTLCSTLEAYTGVEFKVSGTTGDTVAPNTIDFQVQTNSDYPWQPFPPTNMKGTCTAPTVDMAWSMCLAPTAAGLMLGAAAQTVTWAQVMGGSPVMWSPTASPKEVVGLQWQFPWSETRTAYTVDVTLDDVKFTGGTGPTSACPAYMAGMGGAGGAGGSGGSGGSSAGSGGSGGSSAGSGGSSAGSGGSSAGSGGSSAGSGGRSMGGMGGTAAGSGGRSMGGAGGSI